MKKLTIDEMNNVTLLNPIFSGINDLRLFVKNTRPHKLFEYPCLYIDPFTGKQEKNYKLYQTLPKGKKEQIQNKLDLVQTDIEAFEKRVIHILPPNKEKQVKKVCAKVIDLIGFQEYKALIKNYCFENFLYEKPKNLLFLSGKTIEVDPLQVFGQYPYIDPLQLLINIDIDSLLSTEQKEDLQNRLISQIVKVIENVVEKSEQRYEAIVGKISITPADKIKKMSVLKEVITHQFLPEINRVGGAIVGETEPFLTVLNCRMNALLEKIALNYPNQLFQNTVPIASQSGSTKKIEHNVNTTQKESILGCILRSFDKNPPFLTKETAKKPKINA